MTWKITCGPETRQAYHPPVAGNGELSLLVDARGDMSQQSFHGMVPTIWWAGRRHNTPHRELFPFGYFDHQLSRKGQTSPEPSDWRQTLDVARAAIASDVDVPGFGSVHSEVFVHARANIIAVTRAFSEPEDLAYTFRFHWTQPHTGQKPPRRVSFEAVPAADGTIAIAYRTDGQSDTRGQIALLADQPCRAEITGSTFALHFDRTDRPITCFIVLADDLDGTDPEDQINQIRQQIRAEGVAGLKRSHEADWQAYWLESAVSLPEKDMETVYHTALYHLRCVATPWSIPVALFDTHWHGRYFGFDEHFGFMGLLTSNHLDLARRVPAFRFQGLERAFTRASRYGQTLFNGGARHPWETVETGEEAAPSGFWLDHIFHMAHIALSAWQDYRYSDDLDFLAGQGYPVIKACAEFFSYQSVYTLLDGRTVIGKCTDLERLGSAVENAYMTTCGAIATLRAASQAAARLGRDGEQAMHWAGQAEALVRHLPHDGEKYIPYPGCAQKSVAVMSGLFPYGAISPDDPLQLRAIDDFCQDESAFGNMYPVGKSVCTWYAAWKAVVYARLGDGAKAYAASRQGAETAGCFSEIYEINEPAVSIKPWFSTAEGTYVQGINEMLLQSDEKAIRIAPAVPDHWRSFSFCLAAVGGYTVSAKISQARLIRLEISRRNQGPSAPPVIVLPAWLADPNGLAQAAFPAQGTVHQ